MIARLSNTELRQALIDAHDQERRCSSHGEMERMWQRHIENLMALQIERAKSEEVN
jgi:hypothetical protein